MHLTRFATAALCAAALSGGAARAVDRPVATNWVEPTHALAIYFYTEWAENVRNATDGEIDFEVFSAGSLVGPAGTVDALTSGLAQVGQVAFPYQPSLFPIETAIADLGFVQPDPFVLMFAYADFAINEAAGREDFEKAGIIFGGGMATSIYNLLCKDEVKTLADLRGKKVRTPGAGWSRVLGDMGMVPVGIAWNEIYTALERGAVDCVTADASALNTGPKLMELVKSVVRLPLAPYFSSAMHAYNPDYWAGLTADQRKALLTQSARAMVRQSIATEARVAAGLDEARAMGVDIVEPGEDMQKAYRDWIEGGMGGAAETARKDFRIEDPEALFTLFTGYIDKWTALLDGVDRTDEEALVSALMTNLVNNVDTATYGIR